MSYQCPQQRCGSTTNQLVQTIAGLACPACAKVIQAANAAKSLPSVTPQGKDFLDGVIAFALLVGVVKAADKWL